MTALPRITFLVMWPDHFGGTELATLQAAEQLSTTYDVEILGVIRDSDAGFFERRAVPVRHLVDRRAGVALGDGADGLALDDLATLDTTPPRLVEPGWEGDLSLLAELALAHALASRPPDVVLATTPPLMALAAVLADPSTVVIGVEHRSTVTRGASIEPIVRHGRDVDAIVTLTSEGRDWLSAMFGSQAPELAVIPNMIRSGFTPQSPLTSPVIVAAGRHTTEKRFGDLVRAFAPVARAHPDWSLRLFGDGPETNRLSNQVRRLGLHDQVLLVPPVADIPTEMARASVLALSSANEGLPLVMLEALAVGLPIVSYDCPIGPRHIVTHEFNGLLVPPLDVDALSAALERVVSDADLRRRLGEGARERRRSFRPEAVAEQWRALIDELLERRRRHRLRHHRRALFRQPVRPVIALPPATPTDEFGVVLDHVTGALDACRATWFAVRTASGWDEVAVDVADREPFLRALGDRSVALVVTPDSAPERRVPLRTDRFRVAEVLRGERSLVVALREHTSEVHAEARTLRVVFWTRDGDGILHTRAESRATTAVDPATIGTASISIGTRQLPTVPAFVGTWATDIAFPIDAVYTWVDGSDPRWYERMRRRRGDATLDADTAGTARFRDLGELRYSLRSLYANAPWIRHIWLVTDDQVPAWLDRDAPGLTVVSHREIFADPAHLPVFNSHAIEANLHRISGLSEHFLAMNDDLVLARPVRPQHFFTSGGLSVHHPSPVMIGPDDDADQGAHMRMSRRARQVLEAMTGQRPMTRLTHTPHALRRSMVELLEREMPHEFARASSAPFRGDELSIPSFLYPYWALLTGRGIWGHDLESGYFNTAQQRHSNRYRRHLDAPTHVVALGDSSEGDVEPDEQRRRVTEFLETLCPVPSPWETAPLR